MRKIDLTGQRFGRLVALSIGPVNRYGGTSAHSTWRCRCDCGTETFPETQKLRSGSTRSCGCLLREATGKRAFIHGGCVGKPCIEYESWASAIDRCANPNNHAFKNYGGRGIKMCERWRSDYANFFADMGPRPSPKHSLDRYPNMNGDYEPGNCRWATSAEQARNRRNTIRVILHDGSNMIMKDYAALHGVAYSGLYYRLRFLGMTAEEAVADMAKKQRHGTQVLSREDADEIRRLYVPRSLRFSGKALAARFGVAQSTISAILCGQNWKSSHPRTPSGLSE